PTGPKPTTSTTGPETTAKPTWPTASCSADTTTCSSTTTTGTSPATAAAPTSSTHPPASTPTAHPHRCPTTPPPSTTSNESTSYSRGRTLPAARQQTQAVPPTTANVPTQAPNASRATAVTIEPYGSRHSLCATS